MDKINILFCTDKNYVMPMSVAITSIFENNKDLDICIYVFHSEILKEQEVILLDLAKKYNQEIKLIFIEDKYFKDAPVLRWSRETYFRLLICQKIKEDIDRLIYLDCDMIVNRSIKSIQSFDLDRCLLGMLEEKDAIQIKIFNLQKYFQSGIIIFDFKNIKQYLDYNNLENTISIYRDKIITVDQDILNILFSSKIKGLPNMFNNINITTYENNKNRILNIVDNKIKEETIVFHYIASKPWNNIFSGSCEDIWMKYLKLSPYSYLYKEKYNKLRFKILRLGIFKVLFYNYIYATPYINSFFKKILNEEKYKKMKSVYRKYFK